MDPLSITTGILTFIDTTLKLKAFLGKPGQNRERLVELLDDVVLIIREFDELCRAHREVLRQAEDFESSISRLLNRLMHVRDRCEKLSKLCECKGIAKIKATFKALISADDMEAEVFRLKEFCRDCLQRFIAITTTRTQLSVASTEGALLVATSEQRVHFERLDIAYGRLLVASHASGDRPATDLDKTPAVQDFEYLRLHVRRISQFLDRLSVAGSIIPEEPQGKFLTLKSIEYAADKTATPFRRTLAKAINTVQDLEDGPSPTLIQDLAMSAMTISSGLHELRLIDETIRMQSWGVMLYRVLTRARQGHIYLPFLHTGLMMLVTCHGWRNDDALIASQAAMDMVPELLSHGHLYRQEILSSYMGHPLVLMQHGRLEDSIACCQEGLSRLREFPPSDGPLISWSAEGSVDLTTHDVTTAQFELTMLLGLCGFMLERGRGAEIPDVEKVALPIYQALRRLKTTDPRHANMHLPGQEVFECHSNTAELTGPFINGRADVRNY